MTETADKLSEVKPSAIPSDAEVAAWQTLPREEQLRRLRAKLEHADCRIKMHELPGDLRGEDWLFAMLLSVLTEACSTLVDDELKSWERVAYAHAMKELDQDGFVKIQSRAGNQIVAKITPRGKALLGRLSDEVGSFA